MKRLLLCTLALTLGFALMASATDTRVITLGQANMIIPDEANIFLFPSTLNMYKGLALAEVNASGLNRLGIHYDFGEGKGIVGFYVDQNAMPLFFTPQQVNPPTTTGGIDNRLNLFYARNFGEIPFGLYFTMYHDSYKTEGNPADKSEQSNTDFGLVLGVTLIEKLEIAAMIDLLSWTNKDANGDDLYKPKSNMSFGVKARCWHEFTEEVDFVPHLAFDYISHGYEQPNTTEYTEKTMEFDLGWGVNIRPEERILVLFDLGIVYEGETDETTPQTGTASESKHTWTHLPYFRIGLEGHVTKWWDVRLGATKIWEGHQMETGTNPTVTNSYGGSATTTYLGSGVHFGNLAVDFHINPDFVLNGPYFITGAQSNPPSQMAYQASIKYTWK